MMIRLEPAWNSSSDMRPVGADCARSGPAETEPDSSPADQPLVFADECPFECWTYGTWVVDSVLAGDETTNGWRDLVVEVSGDGMAPTSVRLQFNGSAYPSNPSLLDPIVGELPSGTTVLDLPD